MSVIEGVCRESVSFMVRHGMPEHRPYLGSRRNVMCMHILRRQTGSVIEGWELAVTTMKKGEVSVFVFHPHYAYGEAGCPPKVPPHMSLIYCSLQEQSNDI
ncbi:UNVERIFIED_CONTAM: Peptidyl-prolyl cis-trans isomerase FKBP20-1 [Trichonephila clavipes]